MSNIQRHRLERNGSYLAEDHDGGWVLHSDHAAELARVEGERDSIANSIMAACTGSGCLNAHELRAALDRTTLRALYAEHANTIIRAECEAWRAFRKAQTDGLCSDVGDAIVATFRYAELLDAVDAARAATDAAGILKGAGT